jgi:short-subunit dehydrogenase
VNIASVAGFLAGPGMSAYAASKFATTGFSDALRREMRHFGVKVSIIAPGFYASRLPPSDRLALAWLCDEI